MKIKTTLVIVSIMVLVLSFSIKSSSADEQVEIVNGYYKEIKITPLVRTKTGTKLKVEDELIRVSPDLSITICGHGPYDVTYFSQIVGKKCQIFISTETSVPVIKSISLVCE